MSYWHLTWSSDGRMPLFPNETARRRAVHALVRVAGPELVLFSIVDEHLHLVSECSLVRRSRLITGVSLALKPIVEGSLDTAFPRPVETRSHLQWLVRYCLEQPVRHDLGAHPALWSGSCFQDLVGARVVDGFASRIRNALPRIHSKHLFEIVKLPEVTPVPMDKIRSIGSRSLVEAAAAAIAVEPRLEGRSRDVVRARRSVAYLGHRSGISWPELGWALGVKVQCLRRSIQVPAEPKMCRAIRLQLALVEAVGGSCP